MVDAPTDQVLAVRREAKIAGRRVMHNLHEHGARGDVPYLNSALQTGRCEQRAVRTEANTVDAFALAMLEALHFLARRNVPDAGVTIKAAGAQILAVGTEMERPRECRMHQAL